MTASPAIRPTSAFSDRLSPAEVTSQRSCYADQPTSLGTRLIGLGGTLAVALVVLAGMVLTWTTYSAPKAPPALSVFDVAPPASPPEPVRDVPQGPEKVRKDKPAADVPKMQAPKVIIPSPNILAVTPPDKPDPPDPGPPVTDTTAPVSKPAPPAPQLSSGKPTWQGLVLGALDKVKRYPREAHFTRAQGVPYIRFTMDRQGKVLSVTLERSSGVRSLDNEALTLPRRAQPLPKPPADVKGDPIELVVPVEFLMR